MEGEVVVLTGAAGCLGFHVLKLLIRLDERVREVRCLDCRQPEALMKTAIEEELRRANGQDETTTTSSSSKVIKWIEGDVRDIQVVERTVAGSDCIIHCAARMDLWSVEEERDVAELETINVGGTETLLRAALTLGVPRFVHVSSFETYASYDTIYYATEQTLPEVSWFLFGSSGRSKRDAEQVVKRYSNNKLQASSRASTKNGKDALRAVIVRFPPFYGEFESSFVSHLMEVARFFNGKLQRYSNIWIRQQPIYVENAAWALLKAKQCLADPNSNISGEEFHVTDDTPIVDPFDFAEPFLGSRGLTVTKEAHFFLPTLILVWIFSKFRLLFKNLNFIRHWFPSGKSNRSPAGSNEINTKLIRDTPDKRWFHYVTPAYLGFMCNSSFLNRTKASLRLKYEPITTPEEAKRKSLKWYKEHLKL